MKLPELPKLRKHKEADITNDVLKWFVKNYDKTVALEIKIKGNTLQPHQRIALNEVASGSFKFKIPDTGRKNPFDGIVLKNADAFVVMCDGRDCVALSIDGKKRLVVKI